MTIEERLQVLEKKMDIVSSFISDAGYDVARLAADKHDVDRLQNQIDGLAAQVSALSVELQAARDLS